MKFETVLFTLAFLWLAVISVPGGGDRAPDVEAPRLEPAVSKEILLSQISRHDLDQPIKAEDAQAAE